MECARSKGGEVKQPQPTITANVSEKTHKVARRKAFQRGKSLRVFAGEILETALGTKKKSDK